MCGLSLYFDKNDPEFKTKTVVVDDSPNNYISHIFISSPVYNMDGVKIGYKVADDYVQQVGENKYIVTINSSYYIEGKGALNWRYVFMNTQPNSFYVPGVLAKSTIFSGTDYYANKKGHVSLMPLDNGRRNVKICFC